MVLTMNCKVLRSLLLWGGVVIIAAGCSTTDIIREEGFEPSSAEAGEIVSSMPDYSDRLATVEGSGRVIVSEPGNSERASIRFAADRQVSRVNVRNSLGIEGADLRADKDSLIIYNKVDNIVRKVSVDDANLTRLDHIATLNIINLINFTLEEEQVERVLESSSRFLLQLKEGGKIYVNKESYEIEQIDQPSSADAPYGRIVYESYADISGLRLPRRITIFSQDSESKLMMLVQSLEINPSSVSLDIDIPDDAEIIYR